MAKKKENEKPAETPAGELVTPSHGHGKLWRGKAENHVPGPGRPPSEVKRALRKDFDELRPILREIAEGGVRIDWIAVCPECGYESQELTEIDVLAAVGRSPKVSDRIKAIDVMGKYSDLDLNVDVELVEKLGAVVAAEIEDEGAMQRIKEQWLEIVASRIALG